MRWLGAALKRPRLPSASAGAIASAKGLPPARWLGGLHLDYPFARARMLRSLLLGEGAPSAGGVARR